MVEYTEEQRKKWLASLDARPSSAAVLIENEQGELLVVKAHYKRHFSPPGGVIDPGEAPHEAAIREVEEEVNLSLSPGQLTFIAVAQRESANFLTYQFIFHAKLDNKSLADIKLLDGEIELYKFISREEVKSSKDYIHWSTQLWADDRRGYVQLRLVKNPEGSKYEQIVKFIGQ